MIDIQQPEHYLASVQSGNFFLLAESDKYLSHTNLAIDFPMWLTKEGSFNKEDNVILAAVEWIQSATNVPTGYLSKNCEIYPNPATDYIFIKKMNESDEVQIYDTIGKLLIESSGTDLINIESLEKGLYFIKIGTATSKFIKK